MRSVIFDLDGTLADTSGDLLAAANACFRGLGLGDLIGPADAGTALKGGRAMLRLGFSRVAGFGEAEVDAQYPLLLEAYGGAIRNNRFWLATQKPIAIRHAMRVCRLSWSPLGRAMMMCAISRQRG